MSPRCSVKLPCFSAWSRNRSWPLDRLSYPTTAWPSRRRRSASVVPMKPAAPVMKARMTYGVARYITYDRESPSADSHGRPAIGEPNDKRLSLERQFRIGRPRGRERCQITARAEVCVHRSLDGEHDSPRVEKDRD